MIESKDCNNKINGRKFFDQPVNNDLKAYENISKLLQVEKMSIQKVLNADLKRIQQINFIANLERAVGTTMILILDFSQGTMKVLKTRSINFV